MLNCFCRRFTAPYFFLAKPHADAWGYPLWPFHGQYRRWVKYALAYWATLFGHFRANKAIDGSKHLI